MIPITVIRDDYKGYINLCHKLVKPVVYLRYKENVKAKIQGVKALGGPCLRT